MKIKLIKNRDYPELKALYDNFQISEKGEICLAVGGDGTFVKAAKEFSGPILPIRSGAHGSIGYYSDIGLKDIGFAVANLKKKRFVVEKLENKIEVIYKGRHYYAVNEALLHNVREEVSFKIYEKNSGGRSEVYPYIMGGDGVLITGAIGSTAYNKSAGGPIILSPNALCLTFLNADGPYRNPIIIDSTKTIQVEVVKYRGILRYDGTDIGVLKAGDKFDVKISNKELKIIRFKDMRESLAKKLDRIIKSRMIE